MTVRTRIAKLEKLNPPVEIKTIVCFPMLENNRSSYYCGNSVYTELAPGVFAGVHYGADSVTYDTIEQLNHWLSLPEQNDPARNYHAYKIMSKAECDKIHAELESEC